MRDFFAYLGLFLFGLAGVTMFLIVREVPPLLSPEDQITLSPWKSKFELLPGPHR